MKEKKNLLQTVLVINELYNIFTSIFFFLILTIWRPFKVGFLYKLENIIKFFRMFSLEHKDIRSVLRIEFVRKLPTFQIGPMRVFKK